MKRKMLSLILALVIALVPVIATGQVRAIKVNDLKVNKTVQATPDLYMKDTPADTGVEPNPDLRAERVPSEVAFDVAHSRAVGTAVASATFAAWAGDVRGMIVWSPDYRFVWSPRNVDVRRRGA